MPSGSPSRPRSRSSSQIISASASGTPVASGIAPRIGGTQARQLDSGSHGQYSWWWRAAEPKSQRIGSRRGRRARSGCSCRAPTCRSPCSSRSAGCSGRRAAGSRARTASSAAFVRSSRCGAQPVEVDALLPVDRHRRPARRDGCPRHLDHLSLWVGAARARSCSSSNSAMKSSSAWPFAAAASSSVRTSAVGRQLDADLVRQVEDQVDVLLHECGRERRGEVVAQQRLALVRDEASSRRRTRRSRRGAPGGRRRPPRRARSASASSSAVPAMRIWNASLTTRAASPSPT